MKDYELAQYCLDCYKNDPQLELERYDVDLYYKRHRDCLVICVQGSTSFRDWMINFDFLDDGHGRHQGYTRAFESIKNSIDDLLLANVDVDEIYCTGHSAGGALAQFIAYYIIGVERNAQCVIFGSPKIGKGFDISIRSYENIFDIVTYLPLTQEKEIDNVIKINKFYFAPHAIENYVKYLKKYC